MEQYFHFIVNKQSKKSKEVLNKLVEELPKYTQKYNFFITENIRDLEDTLVHLNKKIKKTDILVIVGGDGSLNHFISLTEKYNIKNPLGYIPAGSGNDFARSQKIPINTNNALNHLFQVNKEKKMAIIRIDEGKDKLYAANSLGIGIDGTVINLVHSKPYKEYLGQLSYISSIFTAFIKQTTFPLTLKVDQGIYNYEKCQLVVVVNNPFFGGGIEIIPEANGDDDNLNILVANNVSAFDLIKILIRLLFNKSHLNHPKLNHFVTKNGAFYIDSKQFGQKDGEPIDQDGYAYIFNTKSRSFWI